MTRDEKIAEARRLRAEGLSYERIGQRLGFGRTTHRAVGAAWRCPRATHELTGTVRNTQKCLMLRQRRDRHRVLYAASCVNEQQGLAFG